MGKKSVNKARHEQAGIDRARELQDKRAALREGRRLRKLEREGPRIGKGGPEKG